MNCVHNESGKVKEAWKYLNEALIQKEEEE